MVNLAGAVQMACTCMQLAWSAGSLPTHQINEHGLVTVIACAAYVPIE